MGTLQIPKCEATQNSHNGHTKIEFSMTIVVILYDIHTLEFTVVAKLFQSVWVARNE